MRSSYEIVDRDPESGQPFAAGMLRGWAHGEPTGLVIHRQGNPGAPAINSIRWGIREQAFSIHWYVDGAVAYECVPETRHAYHVLQWREAHARGRPVYRSSFMTRVPKSLTAPVKGEYAGASKPRGDIGQLGIEVVDRVRPDGSIYFDQDSRVTLLLLVRDIALRRARTRGDWLREFYFPISGHMTWDEWTRPDDPGQALYLPDFSADLLDLLTGREPWRTVGADYDGRRPVADRGAAPGLDLAALGRHLEAAAGAIGAARVVAAL